MKSNKKILKLRRNNRIQARKNRKTIYLKNLKALFISIYYNQSRILETFQPDGVGEFTK